MNLEKVTPLVWTLLWLIIGCQSIGASVESDREAALPEGDDQKKDQNITPVMSQQLLNSFHLLIVEALNDMENRIEDKISQLQNVVNDKMSLLDSDTKSRVFQFQTGVKSELSQLQTNLNNKIDTLDTKTENRLAQNFNLGDKFDALENRMEDRFKDTDEKLIDLKERLDTIKDSIDSKKKERDTCQEQADVKPQTEQRVIGNRIYYSSSRLRGRPVARPDVIADYNQTREVFDASTQSSHLEAPSATVSGCYRGMASHTTKRYQLFKLIGNNTLDRDILCDTQTDGGGWIVIQRRTKGDVDFYRNWTEYKDGFGTPPGDFWLGNEAIYQLTNTDAYELRIDITSGTEDLHFVYTSFRLESELDNYRLRLRPTLKDVEDLRSQSGISYNNGRPFTTHDNDNDASPKYNSAVRCHGGWWYTVYEHCHVSNLNGRWNNTSPSGVWYSAWTTKYYPSSVEMKIRN